MMKEKLQQIFDQANSVHEDCDDPNVRALAECLMMLCSALTPGPEFGGDDDEAPRHHQDSAVRGVDHDAVLQRVNEAAE